MTWGNVVDYSDNYGCINLSQRGKHLHMLIKLPFMLINNGMALDLITDFYKEALAVIVVGKK